MMQAEPKARVLQEVGNYETHVAAESLAATTADHQDHTFNGMFFDVVCKSDIPAQYIEVTAISVRGELGPMTIWSTEGTFHGKQGRQVDWHLELSENAAPSFRRLRQFTLAQPIRLRRGASVGLYVHSSSTTTEDCVVYDNQRSRVTCDDKYLQVLPGMAHISHIPFATTHPWGTAFRSGRQFVGRVDYSVAHMLWTPAKHAHFPPVYRSFVVTLLLLRTRSASPLSVLPEDVLFHMVNMIPYDWVAEPPPRPAAAVAVAATKRVATRATGAAWRFLTGLCRLARVSDAPGDVPGGARPS